MAGEPKKAKPKRGEIRFNPDENSLVEIRYTEGGEERRKLGLMRDESFSGCSVVIVGDFPLKKGAKVRVLPGRVGEIPAEIRWFAPIDQKTSKIGFGYLDKEKGSSPGRVGKSDSIS